MNVKMMGLITGFSKATSEKIDRERKDEEALMLNRFRIAAANKSVVDAENKEKIDLARNNLSYLNTIAPHATEAQRIVIASNPMLTAQLKSIHESKNFETFTDVEGISRINLDKIIIANKDKIPEKFKTAQDYIASLDQRPTIDQSKVQERQMNSTFFANTSPTNKKMETLASAFGASAAELLSYEGYKASSPDAYGGLTAATLTKRDSSNEQIETLKQDIYDSIRNNGRDAPETEALQNKLNDLEKSTMSATQQLQQDNAKALLIQREPNNYTDEERQWSKNWLQRELLHAKDVADASRAASENNPENKWNVISSMINGVKDAVNLNIFTDPRTKLKTWGQGKDALREGTPEFARAYNAAINAKILDKLKMAGAIDDNGKLSKNNTLRVRSLLSDRGIDVEQRGEGFFILTAGEKAQRALDATRQQGPEAVDMRVSKLKNQNISDATLLSMGYTQEEIDRVAKVNPPAAVMPPAMDRGSMPNQNKFQPDSPIGGA